MKSTIALVLLLSLVLPSMALSPVEQAYTDGVKEGLKLGQLVGNVAQYNIAIQQFNDQMNKTYGANASLMWLPKVSAGDFANNTAQVSNFATIPKPVHKMDGNQAENTYIQY
jgi:hypothetical protein